MNNLVRALEGWQKLPLSFAQYPFGLRPQIAWPRPRIYDRQHLGQGQAAPASAYPELRRDSPAVYSWPDYS